MKTRVTKKAIIEAAKLVKQYGYWSEEVRNYIDQFSYPACDKLSNALQSVYNSNQPKASIYYNMLNDLGLIEEVKQDRLLSTPKQIKADEMFVMTEYEKVKNKLSKCTIETMINRLAN